jgi:hypothetical protein
MRAMWIRIGFSSFCACAALDAVLLLSFESYRSSLGTPHGVFESTWRHAVDVSMFVFYGVVLMRMREIKALSWLLLCHGVLFGVLGLGLCLPWIGIFLAPLTPVGLLYFGTLVWTPLGYPGALGVAAAFVAYNIWLVWAGLTSETKMVFSPS